MDAKKLRILVLFAHPALQKSRVNRLLVEAIRDLEGVTVHDLYEEYPDLILCPGEEQKLLLEHDLIVFQHPFFWYSSPAILKEWMDLVLEYGFAYGTGGTALVGKMMMNSITTGGPAESYQATGFNRYTVRQFLAPFEQTAHLCGMRYLPPHVIHGTPEIDTQSHGKTLCARYRRWVAALRDQRVDYDQLGQHEVIYPDTVEALVPVSA